MQRAAVLRASIIIALAMSGVSNVHAMGSDEQSVEELRNTLSGVLETLVQKGLLTREQAQQLVSNSQQKAETNAKQKAAIEESEKDAIVVARIPETLKQDIVKQVSGAVRPLVTEDVLADAKAKKWGVPGAMPDWLSRIRFSGDIRFRVQNDVFAQGNGEYRDYNAINDAGGITKAGTKATLNTTEDRLRERLRARLGLEATLASGIKAGLRLATGSLTDPVSTNQSLGQSSNRYQFGVDQAWLRYEATGKAKLPWQTISVGRISNPWVSTDLVWDPDLQFEGVASSWRYIAEPDSTLPRNVYLTLGAFPLQEVELSSKDKWLYGAQLGLDMPWDGGGRAQLAAAYYYFDNITGRKNDAVGSTLLNYTAPQFVQKGNTMFDILNDSDTSTERFALAAQYHLLDLTAILELPVMHSVATLTADYVRNLGYKQQDVLHRLGYTSIEAVPYLQRAALEKRTTGWQVEMGLSSGHSGRKGDWRASLSYKYLDRDAVVDAYTDSDFHLGGTGAKGYTLRGDWWFRDRNSISLRYISSDEISHSVTGPKSDSDSALSNYPDLNPFGVDTAMLDLTGTF